MESETIRSLTPKARDSGQFYQDIATIYSYDGPNSPEVRQYGPENGHNSSARPDPPLRSLLSYSHIAGLPVPDARCFLELPGDELWIGTGRGLARRRGGVWRY